MEGPMTPLASSASLLRYWIVGAFLLFAIATAVDAAIAEPATTPDCIRFWPEARYQNYVYDHIVHVLNGCEVQAMCFVSSDVVQDAVRVTIDPGDESLVWLLRGAPTAEFTPRVECRLIP